MAAVSCEIGKQRKSSKVEEEMRLRGACCCSGGQSPFACPIRPADVKSGSHASDGDLGGVAAYQSSHERYALLPV